jgi:hypothetical protein
VIHCHACPCSSSSKPANYIHVLFSSTSSCSSEGGFTPENVAHLVPIGKSALSLIFVFSVCRRAVETAVREVLHGQATARHCAGLLGRVARADYAGFLGRMYTLEAERERDEEGLRRADRAYRAHLSDLEVPHHLIEVLKQSTQYHVRVDRD